MVETSKKRGAKKIVKKVNPRKTQRESQERRTGGISGERGESKRGQAKKTANMRVNLGDIIEGFATSSSSVVQKAASILEEEIAAGIVAAKEVEEKLVNVRKIRAQDKEELMQRFRRDSHEVVDILVDLVDSSVKTAGSALRKIISIRPSTKNESTDPTGGGSTPVVEMANPIPPGKEGTTSMVFENAQDKAAGPLSISNTDLLSASGHSIKASQVVFSPASFNLAPRSQRQVGITVRIPAKSEPGVYSGLIQAKGMENLRAVLVVAVE